VTSLSFANGRNEKVVSWVTGGACRSIEIPSYHAHEAERAKFSILQRISI
jgi:hypothetical protein